MIDHSTQWKIMQCFRGLGSSPNVALNRIQWLKTHSILCAWNKTLIHGRCGSFALKIMQHNVFQKSHLQSMRICLCNRIKWTRMKDRGIINKMFFFFVPMSLSDVFFVSDRFSWIRLNGDLICWVLSLI